MTEKTIQFLLTPPDQWQWHDLPNRHGDILRCGWNAPKDAKALIIFAEGRTEVIEEYFETIRELNLKGYACAIMDWQGHGLSYRYFDDNTRHHSENYARNIEDFEDFISFINATPSLAALPKILLAHSMGANIILHYLAENPEEFRCACLVAPMLGLNPKRFIRYTAAPILKTVTRMKWLHRHAFGQTKWSEAFANVTKHKVSSDPVRREVQPYLFKSNPAMQCGGVTFGWVDEALKSIKKLHHPDYCARIHTPVLMAIAGRDIVVDNDGSYLTASHLPNCEIVVHPQSEHQIHRERDEIRDALMAQFEQFIQKYL